jgi:IrrE N-terminal-like domain
MTDLSFRNRLSAAELEILSKHISSPPIKVGALAADLGLEVVVAPMPLNISGLIKPSDKQDGRFVIKVNKFESKKRQRFTIAHEIAHFLLHRDRIQGGVVDSTLYRSKLSSRLEAEANRLAADILMPRTLIEAHARDLHLMDQSATIEKLSQIFDVSRQAMEIRLGG